MVVADRLRTEFDRQTGLRVERVDAASEPARCFEQLDPPAAGAAEPPGGVEAGNAAADDRNIRFHLAPKRSSAIRLGHFASMTRLGKPWALRLMPGC